MSQSIVFLAETANAGDNSLMLLLTIFVLAVFVGFEIITKIPPTLHTPLMSGSNAISGITIVGALIAVSAEDRTLSTLFGFLAIVFATINVVGGFLVVALVEAALERDRFMGPEEALEWGHIDEIVTSRAAAEAAGKT